MPHEVRIADRIGAARDSDEIRHIDVIPVRVHAVPGVGQIRVIADIALGLAADRSKKRCAVLPVPADLHMDPGVEGQEFDLGGSADMLMIVIAVTEIIRTGRQVLQQAVKERPFIVLIIVILHPPGEIGGIDRRRIAL